MVRFQLLIFGLCLLVSCKEHQHQKYTNSDAKPTSSPVASSGISVPSDTIRLSEVPKQKSILVPEKEGGFFFIGTNKWPLLPPVRQPAGFRAHVQNYTTDDGLALDFVSCAAMDLSGNLWFGTGGGGVSRFDGIAFTNYTTANGLANNEVYSIAADKKGNLWFGTEGGGVSKFDGLEFTNYNTTHGLADNRILSIAEDKAGNLWFGTRGGGVSRFDGKGFTNFSTKHGLADSIVLCIKEDRSGNMWFGTFAGGVSKYDGKNFTHFTTEQGLAQNSIFSMAEDKNGRMWFGTRGKGVSVYEGKDFTTLNTENGLADNRVWSIITDHSGNLWFGTYGGGVSKYDGKTFSNYTTNNGLASNAVWRIVEDQTGNLWFCNWGAGITRFDGDAFTNYTTSHGLSNNYVRSITEDHTGNLWFGTDGGGTMCYDGKNFTAYTAGQGLPGNKTSAIYSDSKGMIWIGADRGLACFDGKQFTHYTTEHGLPDLTVTSIYEDRKGLLWIGTEGGGIANFDGKVFVRYSLPEDVKIVLRFVEDQQGNLWFATVGGGLWKFDGVKFRKFTTAEGLPANDVWCVEKDDAGNLWVGTAEGMGLLPAANNHPDQEVFYTFTQTEGLPHNSVTQIVPLEAGAVAAGTALGIVVFNHSQSDQAIKLNILGILNTMGGYPLRDINVGQNAMFKDKAGVLWMGTGSDRTGLVRFDYSALNKHQIPPVAYIRSVRLNEEKIAWQSLPGGQLKFSGIRFKGLTPFYPTPQQLEVPFKFNRFTIEYAAFEPAHPNQVEYRYMLEGEDNVWGTTTNKTEVGFGNLFEGDYTFKVQTRYIGVENNAWSEPASFFFTIHPPLWRTWWAYFLYLFFVVGCFRLYIKWRERELTKNQRKLEKTVEERTQELMEKNLLVERQKAEVEAQKERSDHLLLNIFPEEVAEELKQTGRSEARQYNNVTVLFTDFVNFTGISEQMSPKALVAAIHKNFTAFDAIIEKNGLEKIKTIGDAYLAVCGMPIETVDHAQRVLQAALDIQAYMRQHETDFEIRIGIHSGPVVAGIVGVKKYAYDIWGDTVNTAARMEQNSEPGKINISGTTYGLVKNEYPCRYRGKVAAKNKGEVDMYFVE